MNINITGKNIDITNSLKEFIFKKIEKIDKKLNEPLKADIVLSMENKVASIEMRANLNHHSINLSLTHPDMYTAINQLVKKMKRKINEIKPRNSV